MQASLYGQVIRWFQNHNPESSDIETTKKKKKKKVATEVVTVDDDDEAVESHIKELRKEVKKNRMDNNKIVRLLSLSYAKRRDEMMSESAVTRVSSTIQKYPCFKKPRYVSV